MTELWKTKRQEEVLERTILNQCRPLEKYVLSSIGDVNIEEITAPMVIATLEPIKTKGHREVLVKVISALNGILDYAVNSGLIYANPCSKISKVFPKQVKKNNPTLRPEELPQLLKDLSLSRTWQQTKLLIQWELLTMVRPSEACSAEWSEIDFEQKLWTIPAHKMKKTRVNKGIVEHVVPLSTQAISILHKQAELSGKQSHVFPSYTDPNKPMNSETANTTLKRMGYRGKQTAHGMRALASTYLNELEVNPDVIEACLAHIVGGAGTVRAVYNRSTYVEQRREVMQIWGDYVEKCATVSTLG